MSRVRILVVALAVLLLGLALYLWATWPQSPAPAKEVVRVERSRARGLIAVGTPHAVVNAKGGEAVVQALARYLQWKQECESEPIVEEAQRPGSLLIGSCNEGDIDPTQAPVLQRQGKRERLAWCGYYTQWCEHIMPIGKSYAGPLYICEVQGYYTCGHGIEQVSPVAFDDIPRCELDSSGQLLAYFGERKGLYYGGSNGRVSPGYTRVQNFGIMHGAAFLIGLGPSGAEYQSYWRGEVTPWSGIPLGLASSSKPYKVEGRESVWVPKLSVELQDATREFYWGQWDAMQADGFTLRY